MTFVYVVYGDWCDEYEGYDHWDICAFMDKEKAEILVALLNDRHSEIWAQFDLDMEVYNKAYSVATNKIRNHGAPSSIIPLVPVQGYNEHDDPGEWRRRNTDYYVKSIELRE